jgi:coenzyme PQQ precursor peptide PqqA
LRKDESMTWETPQVEEISLSCEINSYSNGDEF